MAEYKPRTPFNVPIILLQPTYETVSGVPTKTFPALSKGILFYGSFKTYGGTEREVNGLYSVIDTAVVECWFRPEITSDCRIYVTANNGTYEILGEPENINLRNQYLKFKVRRIKGGV
jgi:hypothetical protein